MLIYLIAVKIWDNLGWSKLIYSILKSAIMMSGIRPAYLSKYQRKIKIISVIDDKDIIKKNRKHLGLVDLKVRPRPRANALQKYEFSINYSDSQLPVSYVGMCRFRIKRSYYASRMWPT